MFGGAFSTTWAAQQQAEKEANNLMSNNKNNPEDAEKKSLYTFIKKTIELDGTKHPRGYHWLFSLKRLLGTDIEKIRLKLPDEHPLKSLEIPEWNDFPSIYKPAFKKDHPLKNEIELLKKVIKHSKEHSRIDFSNLDFTNDTDFSNLIFPRDVSFEYATFFGKADFSDTLFLKDAVFNNAKFLTEVRFDDVIFFDTADFEGTEFHTKKGSHLKSARFRNTNFKKIANFRNAIFWRYANFKGANFGGRTTFQKAKFKCNAPRFYYATFNYEMTFLGMIPSKFLYSPYEKSNERLEEITKIWRKRRLWGVWQIWTTWKIWNIKVIWTDRQVRREKYKSRIQENQNSYENTSILLEKQGKYHDRHFFFRQEMRCRRRLEGFFNLTTYGIYELLANYGYGVGRALLGWLLHICFWAWMLSVLVFYEKLSPDKLYCSFLTSLSNAHSFFLSKGERLSNCNIEDTAPKDIMRAFDFIWAIETMFGAFFLFLLLLTLRVRFRLGSTAINPTINATITPAPKK